MVSLIALLSSGKGTWGQVNSLMACEKWDKVYLICNDYAYENFTADPNNVVKLKFDEKKPEDAFSKLSVFFKKEIKDFEVALNLISGTGLEHMMVLSAVLKAGLGVRLVYSQNKELCEFKIMEGNFHFENDEL